MNRINPESKEQSHKLRKLGKIILILGGVFTIIGYVSFFSSFGSNGPPKYFWCAFIGLPMVMAGGILLFFGNLRKLFRFIVGETAPVTIDTVNYMGKNTKEGVGNFSEAIFSGLNKSEKADLNTKDRLEKLNELLDKDLIDEEEYKKQRSRILNDI